MITPARPRSLSNAVTAGCCVGLLFGVSACSSTPDANPPATTSAAAPAAGGSTTTTQPTTTVTFATPTIPALGDDRQPTTFGLQVSDRTLELSGQPRGTCTSKADGSAQATWQLDGSTIALTYKDGGGVLRVTGAKQFTGTVDALKVGPEGSLKGEGKSTNGGVPYAFSSPCKER